MKFKLHFEDDTTFEGNSFEGDWNKVPQKKVKAMQFICTDSHFIKQLKGKTTLTFMGYKQYNHLIENIGRFGAKTYSSKILLMAREQNETFIVEFDLVKKIITKTKTLHGMEYGNQILSGWKDGILIDHPKTILN